MSIFLTVLGSGTSELILERSSPAYLVEAGQDLIMLDLGQGSLRRLLQTGADPARLTGVILSHHHLDHMADLLPLLFGLNFDSRLREMAHLTLVGHFGLGPVLSGLAGVFGDWVQPAGENLTVRLLAPGESIRMGGVEITTCPAEHIATSLAWRLEREGASLVYLGDTRATPRLVEFAAGADLVIAHAASLEENPKFNHITPAAAGELAREAGAGGLLLSHLYGHVDPGRVRELAGQAFAGPIWVAEDFMRLAVGAGEAPRAVASDRVGS